MMKIHWLILQVSGRGTGACLGFLRGQRCALKLASAGTGGHYFCVYQASTGGLGLTPHTPAALPQLIGLPQMGFSSGPTEARRLAGTLDSPVAMLNEAVRCALSSQGYPLSVRHWWPGGLLLWLPRD